VLMQPTIEMLNAMRLGGMVTELEAQMERPDVASLPFEDRFGLIVDREWRQREERRTNKRLKAAHFKVSACLEDVDYRHRRGLDKTVLLDLGTCRWVAAKRNVIITGATGLGKTWLACAIADRACRQGFTCEYKRVPRLVEELAMSRADGSHLKFLARLAHIDLLVLDDWGLSPLTGQAQHDMLEVVDDRNGNRSTLLTSQLPISKWHDMVGDPSVADALLDRLLQASTQIVLKKAESLRKETPANDNPAPKAD